MVGPGAGPGFNPEVICSLVKAKRFLEFLGIPSQGVPKCHGHYVRSNKSVSLLDPVTTCYWDRSVSSLAQ